MAWVIFDREFNWSRPRSRFGFHAKAGPAPQSVVHDFAAAAIAAGAARRTTVTAATKPPKQARVRQ